MELKSPILLVSLLLASLAPLVVRAQHPTFAMVSDSLCYTKAAGTAEGYEFTVLDEEGSAKDRFSFPSVGREAPP